MKKFLLIILITLISYSLSNAERITQDLIVLYDFTEISGTTIGDKSPVIPLLDLEISGTTSWLKPGLRVSQASLAKASNARTKLDPNVFSTTGITIEAWIKPLNNIQDGPARIVSFSADSGNRNFTFGQAADVWDQRFRTSDNPGNGSSPSTSTPVTSIVDPPVLQHVVYTRDASGNAKFYINSLLVQGVEITGDLSNWDVSYGFGLFNELNYPTDTRTWLGDIFLVAIYSKNLTAAEIEQNYTEGKPTEVADLIPTPIEVPAPDEYGKFAGNADDTYLKKVHYIIPYEIRGNVILNYEVWDSDSNSEIIVKINSGSAIPIETTGNDVWSPVQALKVKDIMLCDDNKGNIITFENILNASSGSDTWGIRNVSLKRDEIQSDITLYTYPTDKDLTVAWDSTNDPEKYPEIFYDFYLWNHGEEKKYLLGRTQLLQVTMTIPRTGLWIFYARSCNKAFTETDRICSSWGNSNLTELDGTPFGKIDDPANPGTLIRGNWIVYGHIAAPSGGEIE